MPNDNTNSRDAGQRSDGEKVEPLLYQALLRDGRVIPRTPEEAALVGELMAGQTVELPPELLDPEAVLRGTMTPRSLPAPPPVNPETVTQLACAARNGGDIPPPVRRQMEEDRNEAERDQSDGHS